jgi:hypothetical protein
LVVLLRLGIDDAQSEQNANDEGRNPVASAHSVAFLFFH